jgi:hypothetical protein
LSFCPIHRTTPNSIPKPTPPRHRWIVDNRLSRNIKFVTHVGDVVNVGTDPAHEFEWINARTAHDIMDVIGLPNGLAIGNHDINGTDGGGFTGGGYDPTAAKFREYFGPQMFAGATWYGGASPSELSNYQIADVGGGQYILFMHMCIESPAAELNWAQQIINQYPNLPVWITIHRYLYDWRILGQGRYGEAQYIVEPLYRHDGIQSRTFWTNFIYPNRQIFMVHCGHNDGEYRQVSTNIAGLPVHEVLADYQSTYGNGGNGWLRIMTFKPDLNQIYVETYSPTLQQYRTGSESQFTLNVDLDQYVTANPVLQFRDGLGGYNGTVDNWIDENHPNDHHALSGLLTVDDDTDNNWFADYQGQALIRFENLIGNPVFEGDPTPTNIPANADIIRADLSITLADDTNLGNPEFYIHRMLVNWPETCTWNSLGSGITLGSDADSSRLAMFFGDNNPDGQYNRTVEVTSAIQAWSNGSPNYGLGIIPQRVDFNDDGIDIHSSDSSDPGLRPTLIVEFNYNVINRPPVINVPLAASELNVGEGRSIEFTLTATDPNPMDPLTFSLNGADVSFATGGTAFSFWAVMPDEGEYTFIAGITDDEETVYGGQVTITVSNVDPNITMLTGDLTVNVDELFTFEADAFDMGPHDVLTFAWDLNNDGLYDDFFDKTGQWSYSSPGTYTVSVEVSDGDGGLAYGSFEVQVLAIGPDMNCDGFVNSFDIDPFVKAILDPVGYEQMYPDCDIMRGDVNGDSLVNSFDIDPFVAAVLAGN